MNIKLIPRNSIETLSLSFSELFDLLKETIKLKAKGEIQLPPKPAIYPRNESFINSMPSFIKTIDIAGMKIVSYYPDNKDKNLPTINGIIILHNTENGLPEYILDANWITAYRTALVSAIATEKLHKNPFDTIAIIGSGVQAKSHIDVFCSLFSISKITLFSTNIATSAALKNYTLNRYNITTFDIVNTPDDAIRVSDIIISTTPILKHGEPFLDANLTKDSSIILPIDYASAWKPSLYSISKVIFTDDKNQFLHYHNIGYFKGFSKNNTLMDLSEQEDVSSRVAINLGIGAFDVVIAKYISEKIPSPTEITL